MKFKALFLASLLVLNSSAFAAGGKKSNEVSLEEDLMSGTAYHLPMSIEETGEIVFGYNLPFVNSEYNGLGHEEDEINKGHSQTFHVSPTFALSRDKINRYVSKDRIPDVEGVGEVVPAQDGKGFTQLKSMKLLVSAGLDLDLPFSVGAFGPGLGLSYSKSKTSYAEMQVKDLKEKRKLKLPANYADFSAWRTGEKLSYISSGSIIFNAGLSLGVIVNAGAVASASGEWLMKLRKIDEDTFNVSISSIKGKSLGVEIDNVIFSVSTERLSSVQKNLNFKLNMRSPKVVKALKKLYKGDFRDIQNLAQDPELVSNVVSSEGNSKGKGKNFTFSVPLLFGLGASKYTTNTYQASLDVDNKEAGIAYTNIVSKNESSRGILSNHKKEIEQFATSRLELKHEGSTETENFMAASFKWHYEKDDVKASVVKEKLKDLALQVGYDDLNNLKFDQEELSHLRISFDISFTESDIYEAVNALTNGNEFVNIKDSSGADVENYIAKNSYQEMCPTLDSRDVIGDKNKLCAKELKTKTQKVLEKMSELAKVVKKDILSKDYASAVSDFSKLGAQMVKNQFALRSLTQRMMAMQVSLSLEGEKVAKQRMILMQASN